MFEFKFKRIIGTDDEDLLKYFPNLDDVGVTYLRECIPQSIKFINGGVSIPAAIRISDLLKKYGYATISSDPKRGDGVELTDKGRDAKKNPEDILPF